MSFDIIVTVYRYFFNFTLHYGQDYRPSYRLCGGDICMTIMILLSICFVFSLLVSFIYQTIVNHNLINIFSLPDYDLLFESPIEIGDDVYDLYTGLIAKYCGDCIKDDNNMYSVIVFIKENTVYYTYSLKYELIKINLSEA